MLGHSRRPMATFARASALHSCLGPDNAPQLVLVVLDENREGTGGKSQLICTDKNVFADQQTELFHLGARRRTSLILAVGSLCWKPHKQVKESTERNVNHILSTYFFSFFSLSANCGPAAAKLQLGQTEGYINCRIMAKNDRQ